MLRRISCAAVIVLACFGVAMAEEFTATITKVDGNKVTFYKTKFDKETKKLEKGEAQTLTVKDGAKVVNAKFNKETKKVEAGDEVAGGLKASVFQKIGDKGVGARLVTSDDNKTITEIRVFGKKGK
jgi:hypothetical protein